MPNVTAVRSDKKMLAKQESINSNLQSLDKKKSQISNSKQLKIKCLA